MVLARRDWIMGGLATLAAARPASSAGPVEVLTADVRPLSIAEGPRRGIVLDIVRDCLKAADLDARFTFLPFAEALQRTQSQSGALMAPLARSPQREAGFAWIAKVIDVPQAMGTLRGRPAVDLDGARGLARIGVVKGGVQEGFLKEKGFTNLVSFDGAQPIAQALADGKIDAWYATAPEIVLQFDAIGRAGSVQVGSTIQSVPVWLAGNRDTGAVPVARIQAAIEGLRGSGGIDLIYKGYMQR